ncbi:EFR1 family ferrodoxin [Acetobacterium sp.]|uniref:EFR1 family ferrodoxin n=1 Tax=Acetobacterium sp. TaxID=1872094 RepID=UPI002F41F0DA
MDYKYVNLVYFTGTGGTARVADAFEQAFLNQSINVHRTELNGKNQPVDSCDLLVVIFPVHAFNAPKSIDEWIEQAPPGRGRPVAVISVSGGGEISPNTACRAATNQRLKRKGYHVVYEKMFVMPSNFMIKYEDILCAMLLGAAPRNAEKAVSELLTGICHRTTPFWIDRVASKLGVLEKIGAKFFGKCLKANENCINCGWCAQNCPRGNITIVNDKITFGGTCVICLRCVYGCSQKAIEPGIGKFLILKGGFDLRKIENKIGYMTVFPSVEQVTQGSLLKRVKAYLIESGEK